MNNNDSGYIFLSYSNEDVVAVRKIRNALEEKSMKPIMLYLHSLKKKSAIRRLIKQEIKARQWFVYCDSPAARNSEWVIWERSYAAKVKKQVRAFTVDANAAEGSMDELLEKMGRIKRYTTVYVTYSHKDIAIGSAIEKALAEADYHVLTESELTVGVNWAEGIASGIRLASEKGFVVVLVTKNAVTSTMMANELHYASAQQGTIIPVVVGDTELPLSWQLVLANRQKLQISENPTKAELESIVQRMIEMTDFTLQ